VADSGGGGAGKPLVPCGSSAGKVGRLLLLPNLGGMAVGGAAALPSKKFTAAYRPEPGAFGLYPGGGPVIGIKAGGIGGGALAGFGFSASSSSLRVLS